MRFLAEDIAAHRLGLREAYRKNSVTILPAKIPQARVARLDPERGAAFDLLHHVGGRAGARESGKQMNMVFDPPDHDGLAVELLKYSAEIAMEFFPHHRITEERTAILGGKDGMQEDFRERLGHGPKLVGRTV